MRSFRPAIAIALLAAFSLLYSSVSLAQNTLNNAGLSAASPASGAYSLRKLSTAYAGSAVQVVRSSDNATQDIGFTVSGDLDTASLKTFVGANNATVSIWYDQSGNNRSLSQATIARQPVLVSSGVIIRDNGHPAIRFTGQIATSNYQALFLAAAMTTVGHLSVVHRFATGGDAFILGHSGAYNWHSDAPSSLISNMYASASVKTGSGWVNGTAVAPLSMGWPVSLTITELQPATPAAGTAWDNIGTDRFTAHNTTEGTYSELIAFPAALTTTERQALQSNQATYFASASLPVTWLSFTAKLQGKSTLLTWQTATEQNTRHFIIQHSTDGSRWNDLGTVAAAGNSTVIRSYQYTHTSPAAGYNYYRLVQTDLDGQYSYSKVNIVSASGKPEPFVVMTNPVTTGVVKVLLSEAMTIRLYDTNGKELARYQYAAGLHTINVSGLTKGAYLLQANNTVQRIIVQ
ncbi:MAG: T9SS type A sorting domain-containing protein [Niastella sp.]|nr:T9SS type A sorting domain-containing protein [Niastella sp.]